jgi:hypothetical protein
MYYDDMIATTPGKPLTPQVWVCDCHTDIEGQWREIQPTTQGTCPTCNYYSKRVPEIELFHSSKKGYKGPKNPMAMKCREMRAQGLTFQVIADTLGVCHHTARRWCK